MEENSTVDNSTMFCRIPVQHSFVADWNLSLLLQNYTNCSCNDLRDNSAIENVACQDYLYNHQWWIQLIYLLMFASIVIVSVGGNMAVIWIVLAHKRMRTVTNYFLLNLAVADCSISLFNVCFNFFSMFYANWWFGPLYCYISNYLAVVPTCASVFTLMCMSLDRYKAIMYPLKPRLSQKVILTMIITIWIAAGICGLPQIIYTFQVNFYWDDFTSVYCRVGPTDVDPYHFWEVYNHFLFVVTYFLPLVVLFVTYLRIGIELWGGKSIGEHAHEENIRAKKKVVKMMLAVVTIFLVCWLPYHLYFSVLNKILTNTQMTELVAMHIYLNMYWLAMCTTIFNPIIYCWMNSKFRIGMRYAFRWLPCVTIERGEYLNSELVRTSRFTVKGKSAELNSYVYSRCKTSTTSQSRKSCVSGKSDSGSYAGRNGQPRRGEIHPTESNNFLGAELANNLNGSRLSVSSRFSTRSDSNNSVSLDKLPSNTDSTAPNCTTIVQV